MIQKIFIYGSLTVFVGVFLLFAYWLYYPYDPLTIVQPLPVATKVVKSGGRLSLGFDYCSHVAVPVTTTVNFYRQGETAPHLIDTIEGSTTVSQVGCKKVVVDKYVIPPDYISGEYWMQIKVIYQVNPVRQIQKTIVSEHFHVI